MGWTTTKKPQYETLEEFFTRKLTWDTDTHTNKPLAIAIVDGTVMYAAVENVERGTGKRRVWAAVNELQFWPDAEDGYDFGYKDMDETVGPNPVDCPEHILNLLTPTNNARAMDWRATCRANVEARAGHGPQRSLFA